MLKCNFKRGYLFRGEVMDIKNCLIQVIGKDNGVGLTKDMELIITLLKELELNVSYRAPLSYKQKERSYLEYKFLKIVGKFISPRLLYSFRHHSDMFIINIFLEHIEPLYLYQGDINCFIPNPEYCKKADIDLLGNIDYILCKTFFTEKVFKELKLPTYYMGFTSEDRFDNSVSDKEETFFHLAGASPLKGTEVLVDIWLKHPEWPLLTILQKAKRYKRKDLIKADNIQYILEYLEDDTLKRLQNTNYFHLCPSESEGYGHYIAEAMSCGAVTLTTDAPPMNEMVTDDRGVLVKYHLKKPKMLGMKYYVDETDLERKIMKMMHMGAEEKKTIHKKSRQWFIENDKNFRKRFAEFMLVLIENA